MTFKNFIQKLSSALRCGTSTSTFTHSLFDAILTDDGREILSEYQQSSYKAFYNGNSTISGISRKINAYIDPKEFSDYIYAYPEAAVKNLCSIFSNEISDINYENAGDKLAELFISIITEAAGANKRNTPKDINQLNIFSDFAPELIPNNEENILFLNRSITLDIEKDVIDNANVFQKYLDAAITYFSTKKTLLYAEKPHPFYDLYVCNDIYYKKYRSSGLRDYREDKIIRNATIDKLEAESKYSIIEGTGGIGKSMLLTHLFLSTAKSVDKNKITPLFLSLKNYKSTICGIVDFIWKTVKEFDSAISQSNIIQSLQQKKLVLLLDGLDEIQSGNRESFNQDLEAFIKSYPGNTIIMTSRPIHSFVSYSKFSIFDIQPLTKEQSIALVEKLEFWDNESKKSFLEALNKSLYRTHREFASNPLLLTIMLMTYSSFGEVPAKMHVFYSKAYETMARLHDASKGSFKRPLHTKLTPEEFSKLFAQFCARTYTDEVLEFDLRLFSTYMNKVLNKTDLEYRDITPRDFLLDLTDNLCIMFHEGDKYYFIHRSFQEYFAALHFASEYDAKLDKVGKFFETIKNRSYFDRTFDMLYDMIPEKVERFIFLPFLERYMSSISNIKSNTEYWAFLQSMYPYLYYEKGNTGELYYNEAKSFLYKQIINIKSLTANSNIDYHIWPKQIYDLPITTWVTAYSKFLEYHAYDEYPNPSLIPENILEETGIVPKDELPNKYIEYFGFPNSEGITIEIDIFELCKNPQKYSILRNHMEQPIFPLREEFQNLKKYYEELKFLVQMESESDNLFDD